MTITKVDARQEVLSAVVDVNYNDLVSGAAGAAIDVPIGAQLVGGDVTVITPFNSATSDVGRVGDATSATRYAASDIDLQAAAGTRVALTLTAFRHTSTEPAVTFRWTGESTAPSAGKVRLTILYVVDGKARSTQG